MYNELGISNETVELINESEKECLNEFEKIDKDAYLYVKDALDGINK